MAYNRSEHWRPIIEQFEVSGLTQSDFAEQHDINVATLRYWIYKFRDQQVAQKVVYATTVDHKILLGYMRVSKLTAPKPQPFKNILSLKFLKVTSTKSRYPEKF